MINIIHLYTFFFLIIIVLRALFKYQESGPWLYSLILVTDIIALIGLIGFSFRKLIFSSLFWKVFLVFFFAVEAAILVKMKFEHLWQLLYAFALIMPAFYSIFMYAFKTRWDLQEKGHPAKKGESHDSDRSSP